MKPTEKETAVITIRCTDAEKFALAEMAYRARKPLSSFFKPFVKKLAKQAEVRNG